MNSGCVVKRKDLLSGNGFELVAFENLGGRLLDSFVALI